jgi:hypothetical protein
MEPFMSLIPPLVTAASAVTVGIVRLSDCAGLAVNVLAQVDPGAAYAVAGSSEHVAPFDLPRCEPVYPTWADLVGGVSDWSDNSAQLAALYLRRPDIKPLAAARQ